MYPDISGYHNGNGSKNWFSWMAFDVLSFLYMNTHSNNRFSKQKTSWMESVVGYEKSFDELSLLQCVAKEQTSAWKLKPLYICV